MKNIYQLKYKYILFIIVSIIYSSGFYIGDYKVYVGDASVHIQQLEAFKLSLLHYGQLPGYNPWIGGGVPLDGNPAQGYFSIKGLLTLILTAEHAWGLSILLYSMIFLVGSFKFANRLFNQNKSISLVFALLVLMSPATTGQLSLGHSPQQTIVFLPWLLYYLLKFRQSNSGFKAGFIFALAVNDSLSYVTVFISFVVSIIYLYQLYILPTDEKKHLVGWAIKFLLIFVPLSIYRIITVFSVNSGFERILEFNFSLPFGFIINSYFNPNFLDNNWTNSLQFCSLNLEHTNYIGVLSLPILIYGLIRVNKIWLIGIILLIISSVSNDTFLSPMYWIQKLPIFESFLCYTRIQSVTYFFVIVLFTSGLLQVYKSKNKNFKKIINILILLILIDKSINTFLIFEKNKNFIQIDKIDYPISFNNKFYNEDINKYLVNPGSFILRYNATLNNHGLKSVGTLPNFPQDSKYILSINDQDYKGEIYQIKNENLEIKSWSPNQIEITNINTEEDIFVNYNRGKGWKLNNKEIFPKMKSVNNNDKFFFKSNNSNIFLRYTLPGSNLGLMATIISLIISALSVMYIIRKNR